MRTELSCHRTPHRRLAGGRRQHGAAALVVVMLLFFVLSLTAAYTARNLVFEQRTSTQQYRATQAFDAAEAGLEWALSMLNGGRIGADCRPSANPADTSFRDRYLSIEAVTGVVSRRLRSDGVTPLWAACVFDGNDWSCSCPSDAVPNVAAPAGNGPFPAFGVRFVPVVGFAPARPGLIRVEVNGCNAFDTGCLTTLLPSPNNAPCRTGLCAMVGLHSALKTPPPAALTVRSQLVGATLTVANDDRASGGLTVHAGLDPDPGLALTLLGPAGAPVDATKAYPDAALAGLPADSPTCAQCLFAGVFGVRPETYRTQQAAVRLDCSAGCDGATVAAAVTAHPGRPLWLAGAGGLTLDSAVTIGSTAAPVLLVVDGPLTTSGGAQVTGFVYAMQGATLGNGEIRGALASPTDLSGNGGQVVYDAAVLTTLRTTSGSFVRVPGSWRDFQ